MMYCDLRYISRFHIYEGQGGAAEHVGVVTVQLRGRVFLLVGVCSDYVLGLELARPEAAALEQTRLERVRDQIDAELRELLLE